MVDKTQTPPVIRIPGTPEKSPDYHPEFIQISSSRTYRVSVTRAATVRAEESYRPDDVVEVEFTDGTRIWTSSERLCRELIPKEATRSGDGALELPVGLTGPDATRGVVGKILFKTLTFLGVDVAGKTARFIAQKWEERTLGDRKGGVGPGLYRCSIDGALALTRCEQATSGFAANKPVLLFLHGTASSTSGSFGELWEPDKTDLRRKLFAPYQGNVLALEHGSLSTSPVQNAIDLAGKLNEVLPQGARLHLVSHSRGGLVGELLCRTMVEGSREPFTSDELEWFKTKDRDGFRGDLVQLNALLKKRHFRVERFVRVACPAWGTTLASNRLDIYLSILFNLLTKVPFLSLVPGAKGGLDVLTELIMLVAKERSDPSVLPGIEAMIPGGPLVQLLNRPDCKVGGELRVIAGDIEAGTMLSSIASILAQPLYLTDNDLVVDTDAMFGGAARLEGAAYSFHQGPLVSHFSYFKNHDSAMRLLTTLTRGTPQELDDFKPFDPFKKDEEPPPYKRGSEGRPRPVVLFIPGLMGTHLAAGSDRIWLDPDRIAVGMLDALKFGTPLVKPEEPVWLCYAKLIEHLSLSHEVVIFPYDWRLSVEKEAARLAHEMEKVLARAAQGGQPVSIVAHSSGGILARAFIAFHRDAWDQLCKHPKARLILLGTPNHGSYSTVQLLMGRDSLMKQLALLDMKHDLPELTGIFRAFPGVLELLPKEFLEPSAWRKAAEADGRRDQWRIPEEAALRDALRVRDALNVGLPDPERVLYVAGVAPATPSGWRIETDDDGKTNVVFEATAEGDGKATWESGRIEGVKTWFLPAQHGDLAGHQDSFGALVELLKDGRTERLAKAPPVYRGLLTDLRLPEERAPLYTGFEGLVHSALGAGHKPKRSQPIRQVQVQVAHGSLAFTGNPILVGHYQGDTIVSAEAYLDRTMEGRLRNRHRLELYPGDDETAEVFLNPDRQPGGAIVIGLGCVGKLSPGKLMRAVSRGVRSYALAVMESCAISNSRPPSGISTLLVGTNAGGVSVEDSVTAILRGVDHAMNFLQEQGIDERVYIEQLQFIELYEDRAIHAVHAIDRARTDPEIERRFLIDPGLRVESLKGGLRRGAYLEDEHWWQRLEITEDRRGNLAFNVLTDRARSEVYLQQSQRLLADKFIGEATSMVGNTGEEVAVTLFEMLVPNDIKQNAPDRRDVVLILNNEAARYPWEMMTEKARLGRGRKQKPLSVQAGMIRQLQVKEFRDQVVMARGHCALVIGNPKTQFVPLPGAEDEAREVLALLEGEGYLPVSLIGPEEATGGAIIKALYKRDYRIVHLAGHGVFELEQEKSGPCECCGSEASANKITGMVIGDNEYLTPAQLAQMHAVPELVFVNCCHLGKSEGYQDPPANHPPKLAANIATELINMGVKAVVAAGWEVDDAAAKKFSVTFYQKMLAGLPFGQAVLGARQAVYDAYPNVNTWGAYQCYGDHAFCLSGTDNKRTVSRRAYRFAAPIEVVTRLDNISEEAGTSDEERLAELMVEVTEIEERIPSDWRDSGAVLAALGRAYGELNDFAKAVPYYQEALKDERSTCSVKVVEQLCNLQARWAVYLAKEEREAALGKINSSEEQLRTLNQAIGESEERLCILGWIAKCETMVRTGLDEKKRALEKMSDYYGRARKVSECDPYPMTQQLTAVALLHLLQDGAVPAETTQSIEREAQTWEERKACAPDYWIANASANCQLLRMVAAGGSQDEADKIAAGYREAKKSSGSPREFSSILEHLDFLLEMLSAAPEEVKGRLVFLLERIRNGLTAAH